MAFSGRLMGLTGSGRGRPVFPMPADDEAALALRLVRGFEEQGTGWFWETDRSGRLTYLSPKVAAQVSATPDDLIGMPLADIFQSGGATEMSERTLRFHLSSRTSFVDFEASTIFSGDVTWSLTGRPVMDEKSQFMGFVGSGSDLSGRRRAEAEVKRLAMFDSLTGLANRTRMQQTLDQALIGRPGYRQPIALMMLDLDRFKAVNDTLGHQTGDALLKQVAQRLERTMGEGTHALVGRIGGDEFKIILPGENNREDLGKHARALITALSYPYSINGASISIGCSIGIAIAPHDGEDAETLVRNADLALYAAKADGRGVHAFYQPGLLAQAQLRKQMEDELRGALAANQLHLVYQPVISTQTGLVSGYEALLRWTHPKRGMISPADFIPVAEDTGLIEPIGEWALRTATIAAARWPAPVRVAVNVSPIQFGKPNLPALIASALTHSGLEPERLELEITESVFIGGSTATEPTFRSLKALGVRLALDDFGTGYSSLGYLKTAPFDKIKIDQSFVRGAKIEGNRNAAIIRAIVTLAEALGLETTAEGVEAQDEIELIRDLGCSHIQGFVYGKPMREEDVLAQLARQGAVAPIGVKSSRASRTRMLRSIVIEHFNKRGSARLRDVSASGAMIDQCASLGLEPGTQITIELVPGDRLSAVVKWVGAGKAGLQFLSTFDFRRLTAPSAGGIRKAT